MSGYGDPARHRVDVDARQWWRKPAAVSLAVLMMTAMVVLVPVVAKLASAQPVAPFSPVFSGTDNGAIAVFGNANESCPTGQTLGGNLCDTNRHSSILGQLGRPFQRYNDNNAWPMTWVNVDPNNNKYNSSSATVSWPVGRPCSSPACSGGARVRLCGRRQSCLRTGRTKHASRSPSFSIQPDGARGRALRAHIRPSRPLR